MSENTTIARPYAQAAFEVAQEEGNLAAWSDMLKLIAMVVSDRQMPVVLDNPRLSSADRANFVLDICGSNLSDTGKNFVRALAQAGRLAITPDICKLFEVKRLDAEGIVDVEVISAYALDDQERGRIAEAMEKRFGKKINITTRIDDTLIGGSVIRAGDSVIDASIKGRLKELGNQLAD